LQAAFSIGLDSCGGAISASDSNLESGPNSEGRSRLDLYPDERVQGWIPFTLEDGAIPAKLKYELNVFNGETVEVDLSGTLEIVDWEPIQPSLDAPSLGDTNIVFGYSLAALSVVDPLSPGILYTPKDGVHLVSIEILVKNEDASDTLSSNPLYLIMIDNLGFVYDAELGSSDLGQIDVLDLSSGEAAKGYVTFEIPDCRSPLYIRYVTDFWGFEEPLVAGLNQ
jgi:hypothetical protein